MKNELPICEKRLEMKWCSPPLQGWEINSYLVLPVCSLNSRDTKIYANRNNGKMAAGYSFALRLVCVRILVCERERESESTIE